MPESTSMWPVRRNGRTVLVSRAAVDDMPTWELAVRRSTTRNDDTVPAVVVAELLDAYDRATTALRELTAERNTWARQLTDAQDATDQARQQAEEQRRHAAELSSERDRLAYLADQAAAEALRAAADRIRAECRHTATGGRIFCTGRADDLDRWADELRAEDA